MAVQSVTARPVEHGKFGAYGTSLVSGTMAAGLAAGSEIYQYRWTPTAPPSCLVESVAIWVSTVTAFAAGSFHFDLYPARAWSADGTGGATATLTTNNGKLSTAMAPSAAGTVRIATTAALGAGTKTADAQALSTIGGTVFADGTVTFIHMTVNPSAQFLAPDGHRIHPLLLIASEGFSIRATVPATGTWIFGVTTRWAEVSSFQI